MRKLIAAVAILATCSLAAPTSLYAACTNLSDSSGECGQARTCQLLMNIGARTYDLLINIGGGTMGLLTHLNVLTKPLNFCVGGTRSGSFCLDNTGICSAPFGKHCTAATATTDCDSPHVCITALGCPGNAKSTVTDTVAAECSPRAAFNTPGTLVSAADTTLNALIKAGCLGVCTSGLPGAACASSSDCNGGSCLLGTGKPVDPQALGLENLPCNTPPDPGATILQQYQALASCIESPLVGDTSTGQIGDAVLTNLIRSTGTNGTATKPASKTGTPPKLVIEMQGTQLLQIGNGNADPKPSITSLGGLTYVSLAHCVGGNGNPSCLRNTDCGTGGTCDQTTPANGLGGCTGDICQGSGISYNLNTLSVTSTCGGGTAACLRTVTTDAGNFTSVLATLDLAAGNFDSKAPIATRVYLTGSGANCNSFTACPICTGTAASKTCQGECVAPSALHPARGHRCKQDSDCTPGAGCATCAASGDLCTVGGASVQSCKGSALGSSSLECLPAFAPVATIPNPFDLTTGVTPILTAANHGGTPGTDPVCGRCTGDSSIGCSSDSPDCDAVGGPCVFSDGTNTSGFAGDVSADPVFAQGHPSQYAPVQAGAFCTGITGNALVDGTAGLPGPVRVIQPTYIGFAF
jgi:hypothetical protein